MFGFFVRLRGAICHHWEMKTAYSRTCLPYIRRHETRVNCLARGLVYCFRCQWSCTPYRVPPLCVLSTEWVPLPSVFPGLPRGTYVQFGEPTMTRSTGGPTYLPTCMRLFHETAHKSKPVVCRQRQWPMPVATVMAMVLASEAKRGQVFFCRVRGAFTASISFVRSRTSPSPSSYGVVGMLVRR